MIRFVSLALLVAGGCHFTDAGLRNPKAPLEREISGEYTNEDKLYPRLGIYDDFQLKIFRKGQKHFGKVRREIRQSRDGKLFAHIYESILYDSAQSMNEIVFYEEIKRSCRYPYASSESKGLSSWVKDDYGKPLCLSKTKLEKMNTEERDGQVGGMYFKVRPHDILIHKPYDGSRPVTLKKTIEEKWF